MKRFAFVTLLFATMLLAGCGKPWCLSNQPYKHAKAFPPLQAAAGLHVPAPNPTMAIPRVDSGPVGAVKDASANNGYGMRCLVMPPPLQVDQEKAPATSTS